MRRFRARHRGAVLVEYAFLLVAVGVPTLAGLMYGGGLMYQSYTSARESMLSPFP
jgi:Flp pilus assembly pilin Flp